MNLKVLITGVFFTCCLVSSLNAQRTIDLSLDTIYAPDTVYHQVDTYYEFSVRNNGPDTIMPGDTIIYNLIIRDFSNDIYFPCDGCHFDYYPQKNYLPGDTIIISGTHAKVGLVHNFIRDYCAAAYAVNQTYFTNSTNPHRILEEQNGMLVNNGECNKIYYKRYNFDLSEFMVSNGITLYPNPANDIINVQFAVQDLHINQIQVYDYRGQLVIKQQEFMFGKALDVSGLSNGIYILKGFTDRGNYLVRFAVNR